MRHIGTLIIAAVLSAGFYISPGVVHEQDRRPERRAIEKTEPIYPDIAKRAHIRGVVKMEVVVRANGSVKSVKILGGPPVLLESATNAVHHWKYEPAAEDTTELVQIVFDQQ